MTVLKSLLSSFRNSRTADRRSRRGNVPSSVATEALEPRLLLTNPDPFSSLPGAAVTVYLDFDGHTETHSEWLTRRVNGSGDIVTPVFSIDNDTGFSDDERTRIEEIYERVAEDFRPFNINVTTILPVDFNNSEDLLVSIGGDGAWANNSPRYSAIPDSFSTGSLPQTLFVHSTNHNGLGGDFEYNMASSISQAVAVTMGLEVHRGTNGVAVEGDSDVAPILGDSIVGADTTLANPNSTRDIWVSAPGNDGTTNQDDLAEIVANPNVSYRADDYGNGLIAATGITIGTGVESIDGIIEQSSDVDVFSFTTAATFATISLTTTDLTSGQFGGATPGSNLDPILTIRDAEGNVLQTEDGAGLSSEISMNLPDGTYFLEVSGGLEYGNLGAYTLSLGGVESVPTFANPVALNSLASGDVDLFLSFAGALLPENSPLLDDRVDGNGDYAILPYDTDGDLYSYSAGELEEITEIWARVAEDFRPFNVNVTTVRPVNLDDGEAMQVVIGTDGAILGMPDYVALSGAFSDAAVANVGAVFPGGFATGGAVDGRTIAWQASATFAQMLGLDHHSQYDVGGTQLADRDPGNDEVGSILGQPDNALRDIWMNSPDTSDSGSIQSDLSLIDAAQNIDYRADDVGDDFGTAQTISIRTGDDIVSGVIERNDDVDVWRFDTLATTATISITGLNLIDAYPGLVNPGSNLDPLLELYDGAGALVGFDDEPFVAGDPNSLTASVTQTLSAGTYFLRVSNRGEYGNLGQYSMTLQGVDSKPVTVSIDPDTFVENSGVQTGVGTVARPEGELFGSAVTVWLQSQDESEVIVPAFVVIPASDESVSFDVTIVDDTLLDGDQLVEIQALIPSPAFPDRNDPIHFGNAVLNSTDFVTVTDHEEITVSVTPNPVSEDAGFADLTVTRSNTDTGAPNHYVTTRNSQLLEFTADGQQVSTIQVPWHSGAIRPVGEVVHDVDVLDDGRVVVFNGTTSVALSIYSPSTGLWEHIGPFVGLSANSSDLTTGGIAATGNYVFMTDLELVDGDSHGIVRVDLSVWASPLYDSAQDDFDVLSDNGNLSVIQAFGDGTLGSRLFGIGSSLGGVGSTGERTINEYDPGTGELRQRIQLPLIPNSTQAYSPRSISFDGEFLWVLVDQSQNGNVPALLKVDPNTEVILEAHGLNALNSVVSGAGGPENVFYLDGLLYFTQENSVFYENDQYTEVYDPVARRVTGQVLTPESQNGLVLSQVGAGIQGEGTYVFIGGDSNVVNGFETPRRIFEFDLVTGSVVDRTPIYGLAYNLTWYDESIVHISDVAIGDQIYNDLYFVEQNNGIWGGSDNLVDIFSRETGEQIDADPSTPGFIDPLQLSLPAAGNLTGADVPNVSSRSLYFRDVTIGFDGLLYGLEESGDRISVHDPETLQRVDGIVLAYPVNTISVANDLGIYAGGTAGVLTQFDFDGNVLASVDTDLGLISDIEVNVGGEVILSDAGGVVAQTTQESLAAGDVNGVTRLEDTGTNSFVSFGRNASRSTGDVLVSLASSDLTELQVPGSIVIPRGQQSVTIQVAVIDDAARDGSQDVVVAATSPEYASGTVTVTVTDAEQIGVQIAPTEVEETAGVVPDSVTIYRTDVEGPLDFVSTNTFTSPDSVPIVDNDVTVSRISVANQVSLLQDVNVKLSIRHDAIPDLDVFLIGPDGTRIELFTDLSSNESDLTDTILDDEAGTRIVDGDAPFTGRFRPEQSLENYDGLNPSGVWTLEVIDDSASDAGVLLGWELELTTIGLAEMQVTLNITNSDEASVPLVVTIPANQSQVVLPLDVFDDTIVDGTQTVTINVASSTDEAGFQLVGDQVDVLDVESLTVSLSETTVQENAGTAAITGTITRVDGNGPLTVTLTSSDTTEIQVSSTVTFPDGDTTVNFSIDVIDDSIFDGDQTATILLEAPGYDDITTEVITVTDEEPRLKLSAIDTVLSEADGTVLVTISRLDVDDLSSSLVVALTSSDLSELTVPANVTIDAGQISETFLVTIVDDDVVDGSQPVTITAVDPSAVPVVNGSTLDVVVEDAESVEVTLNGPSTVVENAGAAATSITVSLTTTGHTVPVVVTLTNSDATELSIPATVTIPVGQSSVTFDVDAVNDGALDGDQLVTISAAADNHITGSVQITVLDHEPPVLTGPSLDIIDPTPELTWQSLDGATRYDLWVNDASRGIVQLFRLEDLPAINPNGNGIESFVPTQEMGIGIYRYWVRAYDSLEQPTVWSAARTFRIRTAPQITSPTTGVGGAASAFPDINWTSIVDTYEYDLWINNVTTGESQVVRETDLKTTNFATATAGLAGGTYKAWVRATAPPIIDEGGAGEEDDTETPGIKGYWSESVQFTVLSTPEIIAPGGSTFDRTPEIRWNTVEGASFYDVWVSKQNVGQASTIVLRDQFVEGTVTSPKMDLEDGRYAVWVRAIAADGSATAWSQVQQFEIAGRPSITTPLSNTTSTEPPLVSWAGVNQTERYEIWVSNSQNERVYHNTEVVENSLTLPDEVGFGTFRVWVRAISERGELSTWSLPVTFTIVSTDQEATGDLLNPETLLTGFRILVDPAGATQPRAIELPKAEAVPVETAVAMTASDVSDGRSGDSLTVPVQQPVVASTSELLGVDALMSDWDTAVLTQEESS